MSRTPTSAPALDAAKVMVSPAAKKIPSEPPRPPVKSVPVPDEPESLKSVPVSPDWPIKMSFTKNCSPVPDKPLNAMFVRITGRSNEIVIDSPKSSSKRVAESPPAELTPKLLLLALIRPPFGSFVVKPLMNNVKPAASWLRNFCCLYFGMNRGQADQNYIIWQ